MVHMRIVAPREVSELALGMLRESGSVCNVIWLPRAAQEPAGDVILADVAREDASVVLSDLKELDIHRTGSIALESVETQISLFAERAVERARGSEADAVVWEEVESRTSEQVELSGTYLLFIVLAGLIAAVGIFLDSPILIVGAMVVGPEFGPIAGFCVAFVQRRGHLGGALAHRARGGLFARDSGGLFHHARFPDHGPDPKRVHRAQSQLVERDRQPRLLHVLRRRLRGRGGDAVAEHGEVGRAHRGADLGHDDSGGSQHRRSPPPTATGMRGAARSRSSRSTSCRSWQPARRRSTFSACCIAGGACATCGTPVARRRDWRSGARDGPSARACDSLSGPRGGEHQRLGHRQGGLTPRRHHQP